MTSPLQINPHDGTLSFPNRIFIHSNLTQDAFRTDPLLADAQSKDYGTLPWVHYHFAAGNIDDKPLLASVCFYDQLLVYLSLTADLYPPGPKDWSNYSLEVEAATKTFHDKLLTDMLGQPTHSERFLSHNPTGTTDSLNRPNRWNFAWGSVYSSHDFKGGGTSITVRYGNRLEQPHTPHTL